jgi:hypothetical protein
MLHIPQDLRAVSCRFVNRNATGTVVRRFTWMLIAAFSLACIPCLHGAETWRTFTDVRGRKMIGKIVSVGADHVLVKLKSNGSEHVIPFDSLSEDDVAFVKKFDSEPADEPEKAAEEQVEGEVSKRLYPRTKEEIRAGIREIKSVAAADGISTKTHDAVKSLNVFRFLSGLSYNVEGDATCSKNATEAAEACKKIGDLSHDIGHSTDRCNLSSGGNMEQSVADYINDSGENNRDRRGHRAWCLNPPMGKVGFGSAGASYSAMWCMDRSGKGKTPEFWAYPGQGFYPQEYVLGNAWSVYFAQSISDVSKVEVEVFRLSKRPEKALPLHGDIDGRVVPILHKSKSLLNGINFEPEEPNRKGVYWVRVTGGGLRCGYVVEIF